MTNGRTIRLCLLGCGTVGTGVARILAEHGEALSSRLGASLELGCVVVRDLTQTRDAAVPHHCLADDATAALEDPSIDLVVEVMGGTTVARDLVLQALRSGKPVVTANKALLAEHGDEIFRAARETGVDVLFEAAVGGGIPVIRALREGLASDKITSIHAIINGTSNYILSAMTQDGVPYEDALQDAQNKGFAEADPSMDVDGIDAAQKLSILISVGFERPCPYEAIPTTGISNVTAMDVAFARSFGHTIKPLAVAHLEGGETRARVGPCLVPSSSTLANVQGANNAVRCHSNALGPLLLEGQGAGMMPTASAVVSDIVDTARNLTHGGKGRVPAPNLDPNAASSMAIGAGAPSRFYLRLPVEDEPGVLGAIATCIGNQGVSISRVIQDAPGTGSEVQIVLLTHKSAPEDLQSALASLQDNGLLRSTPCVMPIEEL
ncbi:MAG: homoserine dehydrogenase [Myxococcota bacterium]|nr:homoserine dehydrogenase [Myxococcota bacterium]